MHRADDDELRRRVVDVDEIFGIADLDHALPAKRKRRLEIVGQGIVLAHGAIDQTLGAIRQVTTMARAPLGASCQFHQHPVMHHMTSRFSGDIGST